MQPAFSDSQCQTAVRFLVTTGLDPVVHVDLQIASGDPKVLIARRFRMDCRVKPGNDEEERTKRKKKKEAERRQTQCFMSAPAGAGRATERSACADPPLRARSPVGVPLTVLPLGLSIAKVRLQAMLPGTWVLVPLL
ncbi:MAG: hypothetical protein WBD90_07180 [Xanthobacteraceae bacterium]